MMDVEDYHDDNYNSGDEHIHIQRTTSSQIVERAPRWKKAVESYSSNSSDVMDDDKKPLYYCLTSGSTGNPKVVQATRQGTWNRLKWMWNQYPFNSKSTIIFKTNLAFVDSIWEIFGAVCGGANIRILSDQISSNAKLFLAEMKNWTNARLTLTPSFMKLILSTESCERTLRECFSGIEVLVLSGENLSTVLARRVLSLLPKNVPLLNIYGSTECSADCSVLDVREFLTWNNATYGKDYDLLQRFLPIGFPIHGMEFQLLSQEDDGTSSLVPFIPGQIGMLGVTGVGVALGYLNSKNEAMATLSRKRKRIRDDDDEYESTNVNVNEKKGTRFVTLNNGERQLITGDMVQLIEGPNNTVLPIIIGRDVSDRQIKVRGQRFNLNEVENTLRECLVRNDKMGLMVIDDVYVFKFNSKDALGLAIIQNSSNTLNNENILMKQDIETSIKLRQLVLPFVRLNIMIPSPNHWFFTSQIPLNTSGKQSKKLLMNQCEDLLLNVQVRSTSANGSESTDTTSFSSHENSSELVLQSLANLFEISKTDLLNFSANYSFVELGGDSFLSVRIMNLIPSISYEVLMQSTKPFLSLLPTNIITNKDNKINQNYTAKNNDKIDDDDDDEDNNSTLMRTNTSESCSITNGVSTSFMLNEQNAFNIKWKYNLGKCVDASPLICVVKGETHCIIGSHSHSICSLKLDSGVCVWNTKLPNRIAGSCIHVGNLIVVGCHDGYLYALDDSIGKIVWTVYSGGELHNAPLVISFGNSIDIIFVAGHGKKLLAIDCKNGHILVESERFSSGVHGDLVTTILSNDHSSSSISTITTLSEKFKDNEVHTILVPTNNGKVHVFEIFMDLTSSRHLSLKESTVISVSHKAPVFATPVICNTIVICASADGNVVGFDLELRKETWRYESGMSIFATPCLISDNLFCSSSISSILTIQHVNGTISLLDSEVGIILGQFKGIKDGRYACKPLLLNMIHESTDPAVYITSMSILSICSTNGCCIVHNVRLQSTKKKSYNNTSPKTNNCPLLSDRECPSINISSEVVHSTVGGEVFSDPVLIQNARMCENFIVVGSRNDHVIAMYV
eukprot:TRINITY_DN2518_c0_g2_i1.p1 TRINITY_DN2518_c0_g2~~TRINITY_DN2518_c0_g2_i1.p1  ORF type:complete len:1129 (+),score=244.89 TRINITY_DN2518_c0_g2_i1:164-3388(+)